MTHKDMSMSPTPEQQIENLKGELERVNQLFGEMNEVFNQSLDLLEEHHNLKLADKQGYGTSELAKETQEFLDEYRLDTDE